jgi:Leucine-rich repeat (LRR) protein
VADSPSLANLEGLTLRGNSLHGEGAREIAQASNFARLRTLDVSEGGLDGHDALKLLASPYLRKLERLDLSFNPLKEISPELAAAPNWPSLRTLSLRATQLDGLGIRELLRSDRLEAVESLDLRDNPLIDVRSREALVERFGQRVRLEDRTPQALEGRR